MDKKEFDINNAVLLGTPTATPPAAVVQPARATNAVAAAPTMARATSHAAVAATIGRSSLKKL